MTDSYDRLIELLCSHYCGDGLALDPKKELVYLLMNHGPQILKYTQTTYIEDEVIYETLTNFETELKKKAPIDPDFNKCEKCKGWISGTFYITAETKPNEVRFCNCEKPKASIATESIKDEFDVWICDWCEEDFEAGVLVERELTDKDPDKKIMGWICPKCKEKEDQKIIKQRRNPVGYIP